MSRSLVRFFPSSRPLLQLAQHLPPRLKHELATKQARIYVIDASRISEECGIQGHINNIMMAAFFRLIDLLPIDQVTNYIYEELEVRASARSSVGTLAKFNTIFPQLRALGVLCPSNISSCA